MPRQHLRRTVLAAGSGALVTLLAGCVDEDGADDGGGTTGTGDGADDTVADGSESEADDPGNETAQSQQPAPAPAFEWRETDDHVTILLLGGDSFEANRMTIEGENLATEGQWWEFEGGGEPNDEVVVGDEITVEVTDPDNWEIELVWQGEDYSRVIAQQSLERDSTRIAL